MTKTDEARLTSDLSGELLQREQTARALLDASLDAILLIDRDGIILEANQNFADLHGASVDELVGSDVFERLPPSVVMRRRAWLAEVLARRQTLHREDERDGKIFEHIVHPVLDEEGEVARLAVFSRDVTDARMTEAAVYESEHRYRALIDAIPYGIQQNDLNGVITLSNPAHARLSGHEQGELVGMAIWDMLPPEAQDELRTYFAYLVREQPPPTPYVTPNRTKDGRVIDVQVDWTYTRDLYGRLTGFISVITDITEKKRLEKQRAQFVEAIIAAQEEERSRIARELHDETGQALSAILVHLGALEASGDGSAVGPIGEELRQRVRDLLDEIGRLAHGLHPRALDDLGFAEALEQYCGDYARTHGLAVDLHVDESGLPQGLAGPRQIALFRILQELLTNVVRHARAGRVSVVVEKTEAGVRMIVEDDGCGFAGSQAKTPTSERRGFGIVGIRERLALLNGELTIESSPGGGSSIYVDVPVVGSAA